MSHWTFLDWVTNPVHSVQVIETKTTPKVQPVPEERTVQMPKSHTYRLMKPRQSPGIGADSNWAWDLTPGKAPKRVTRKDKRTAMETLWAEGKTYFQYNDPVPSTKEPSLPMDWEGWKHHQCPTQYNPITNTVESLAINCPCPVGQIARTQPRTLQSATIDEPVDTRGFEVESEYMKARNAGIRLMDVDGPQIPVMSSATPLNTETTPYTMLPAHIEDRIARERIYMKSGQATRAFIVAKDGKATIQIDGLARTKNAKENEERWTATAKKLLRMLKDEFGFVPGLEELELNRQRIQGYRRSLAWTQRQLEDMTSQTYLNLILANEAYEDPDLHDVHQTWYEWSDEELRMFQVMNMAPPRVPILHLRNHAERLFEIAKNIHDADAVHGLFETLYGKVVRFASGDEGPAELGQHTEGDLLSERLRKSGPGYYDMSMELDVLAMLEDKA